MSLQRFDEVIDMTQRTRTVQISDSQKKALEKKYHVNLEFEYGRDEAGRYVLRTTKEMMEQMAYYLALKYEEELVDLYMSAEINGTFFISVSYGADALHLQELFQFLKDNQ